MRFPPVVSTTAAALVLVASTASPALAEQPHPSAARGDRTEHSAGSHERLISRRARAIEKVRLERIEHRRHHDPSTSAPSFTTTPSSSGATGSTSAPASSAGAPSSSSGVAPAPTSGAGVPAAPVAGAGAPGSAASALCADSQSSVAGSWASDFSTGDFSPWSWWGQGQSSIWGDISVVNPSSVGIPACDPSNPHVASMTVTPDGPADGQVNAKLYKIFSTTNSSGVQQSPSNVSGTYSASYYIPSSYQVPNGDWSNIFQFKEQYPADVQGGDQSDPLWWVQLVNGGWAQTYSSAKWLTPKPTSPNQPVAVLNYWGNNWTRQVVFYTVPLNQWFQISANVDQDNSIQFSIDGQPFDTALQSQYHTGPFHPDSEGWYFGAGNYSTAPGNTLYLGGASYVPAGT
jgi:hypothetical protein